MSPRRRRFGERRRGELRYKKLFVIAVEGAKTEQQYFAILKNWHRHSVVHVELLRGKHDSSPSGVLRRMEGRLRQEQLKASDEAWLVIDRDQWPNRQLAELHAWSQGRGNYGFALSNPKFEYWLLLHFEDGTGIRTASQCSNQLKKHIPDYDKGIDTHKIPLNKIKDAIRRAKARDKPPCIDWPRAPGGTTVYKLVENIIQAYK